MGGKREALRLLSRRVGADSSHPWARRAKAEGAGANVWRLTWRLRYNLAPTDPRYLDATDELILTDLMALGYYRDYLDPARAEIERLQVDPARRAALEERHRDLLADPRTQRALEHTRRKTSGVLRGVLRDRSVSAGGLPRITMGSNRSAADD